MAPDIAEGREARHGQEDLHQYDALLDVSRSILAHRDLNDLFRDLSRLLRRVLHFDFLNLLDLLSIGVMVTPRKSLPL